MFISHKFIKYLDKKDGNRTWKYEITDSEFGTVSGIGTITIGGVVEFEVAVIQEYGKRNLNVAANLAIALVWYNKQYPYWTIQKLIYLNKYNPPLQQYEKDIQKYLVLL
jgi:hypothetical protein